MEIVGKIIDPFAPFLRPITGSLPGPIEQLGESVLEEHCYDLLVRKVDFVSSPDCVAMGISRALGWGIVLLSSIVKVPQIIKLIQSGSAEGLSVASFLLETAGYVINTAYSYRSNFPFSTFGETVMIAIQNIIITVLIFNFSGKKAYAAVFVALITTVFSTLVNPASTFVSHGQILLLQRLTIPLSFASKIPQVYTNWRNKSTGQLSVFTVVNYLLGSLARVFTTVQEIDDKMILGSFLAGAVLNAILALQVGLYWNSSKPKDSMKKSQ